MGTGDAWNVAENREDQLTLLHNVQGVVFLEDGGSTGETSQV